MEEYYSIVKKIGKGAFGNVYEGFSIYSSKKVAIKKIYFKKQNESLIIHKINNEIKMLKNIDHPYLIKVCDNFLKNSLN